ncbi:MAG: hypothetical protein ACODAF_02395 [Actinomycetota bacterium]
MSTGAPPQEQLVDNPIALVIIAAVALFVLGRYAWRWRRESALRSHAGDRGWRALDDTDGFAELVTHEFPELRTEAEQEARAARRSGMRQGGGPEINISIGSSAGVRSRAKARSVYLVPVEGGEFAVGDVAVTGTTGKLSQARSTVHRGAVAARLSEELPPWKLVSRSWLDRDQASDLPQQLQGSFNDVEGGADARAAYLDSGAWEALLDAPEETDGIAIEGDRLVLLSRKQLTPERVDALADTAQRLVAAASTAGGGGLSSGARLSDPLSPR